MRLEKKLMGKRQWPGRGLAVTVLCGLTGVHAQTQPAPGDIMRQIGTVKDSYLPKLEAQDASSPHPTPPAQGAQIVQVGKWKFEGNTVLDTQRLERLLQNFTGVDVSIQQINEAASWVQSIYEQEGWLARVVLPEQDITEGTVLIRVVEARLGDLLMPEHDGARVVSSVVKDVVQYALADSGVLNSQRVNRGLLLADDLVGVKVTGHLKPGQAQGTTDIVIVTQPEPAALYEVTLDNTNARSVGSERLMASAKWQSPAGFGESYSAQGLKSQGADYVRLVADTPLGHSGLKGNITISSMDYKVVNSDSTGVTPDIRGSAQTLSIDLLYPWVRSRSQNLYVSSGLDQRTYKSRQNGASEADYQVDAWQMGVSGNHTDALLGGGANTYSVSLHSGSVYKRDVNSFNDAEVLGHYSKWRWAFSREQSVQKNLIWFIGLQGQNTGSKPLDSSENFSLGGPAGVRAYPVGEGTGPQGLLLSMEARWFVSPEWLVTPFVDYGHVEKRADAALPSYNLKGAGVSLTWIGAEGWLAKVTYAQRIGNNPNPLNVDKDQDGSLHKDRVWLSLTHAF